MLTHQGREGDGVPVIRDQTRKLSGRMPEYDVIDDSELRLVIWGAGERDDGSRYDADGGDVEALANILDRHSGAS